MRVCVCKEKGVYCVYGRASPLADEGTGIPEQRSGVFQRPTHPCAAVVVPVHLIELLPQHHVIHSGDGGLRESENLEELVR